MRQNTTKLMSTMFSSPVSMRLSSGTVRTPRVTSLERMPIRHPMSDDALVVYIFQCASDDLFAVTRDMTGANLPQASCEQGWILRDRVLLGEYASIPAPIGYYIWRDSCWTQRTPRISPPTV